MSLLRHGSVSELNLHIPCYASTLLAVASEVGLKQHSEYRQMVIILLIPFVSKFSVSPAGLSLIALDRPAICIRIHSIDGSALSLIGIDNNYGTCTKSSYPASQ
jgi:hypothetical protein